MLSKQVIILIITHKSTLTTCERISIMQCASILARYPIVFVCPAGLDVSAYKEICPSASFNFIHPDWQSTYERFNRLKVLPFLYKQYKSYEYILFYEPDAFVFSDQLENWCSKGYDYIGAPWIAGFEKATPQSPFLGIGNGGFSLRRVSSHLKALHSFSYCVSVSENWDNRFVKKMFGTNLLKQAGGFMLDLTLRNNTYWLFNNHSGLEDQFWGLFVAKKYKWFRLPSIEEAVSFSFEMQPRRLFEMNNFKLPFGCHAWWKYDLEFWKPHIEKFGYRL